MGGDTVREGTPGGREKAGGQQIFVCSQDFNGEDDESGKVVKW